ncbi:hypothetical protein JIG36_00685 [Actinoplanes sp. LDG1-06]|uniref:Uncharacterized protein n=1 Tax=Paractinoplanes ovalisporus TaxID=2810368 RepID=A0ABS2A2L6_9ACTN|nr:hypothetical protein [Actinoplanes ovalisporus]MBM2614070.1 hypothetical protein [Actinoplanes ovalisporus]
MQPRNTHGWSHRSGRRAIAGGRCPVTLRRRHGTSLAARRSPKCRDAALRLFPRAV